jgi:hypothetical protein
MGGAPAAGEMAELRVSRAVAGPLVMRLGGERTKDFALPLRAGLFLSDGCDFATDSS